MERQLFVSLDTLEEIAFAPQSTPHLAVLLPLHTQVMVDATLAEVEAMEAEATSALFLLYQQAGTFTYDAAPDWQRNFSHTTVQSPAAVFVVDADEAVCEQTSQRYGTCVVSRSARQAPVYLTRPLARKELVTTSIYQEQVYGQPRQGWYAALTVPELLISKAPLNALVITDTYLFDGGPNYRDKGEENLVNLLRALLPPTLSIDFHVLLVAANSKVPFTRETFAEFSANVEAKLGKPYPIQIGLVTRPLGGKDRRSITSNYYFCTSQHGFTCFTSRGVPSYNNDFTALGAFEGSDLPGYDVPIKSMSTDLKIAKKLLTDNKTRQDAPGSHIDPTRTYLGFCDNRLLSLVS